MPTATQYEIVKQQCKSFEPLGCIVKFEMQPLLQKAAPKILIVNDVKSYRFCDPDWDVVSKQLNTLYFKIRSNNEKNGEPTNTAEREKRTDSFTLFCKRFGL